MDKKEERCLQYQFSMGEIDVNYKETKEDNVKENNIEDNNKEK